MAPHRRSRIASRRRREDDGDEEGSIDGDLEDDSLSEGTISAHEDDADEEGSDMSEDDTTGLVERLSTNGQVLTTNGDDREQREQREQRGERGQHQRRDESISPAKPVFGATVSDTEAMMDGLKLSEGAEGVQEIHFDDMKIELVATPKSANNRGYRRETFAERKRREHDEYIKERDSNPAFVPTRGRFFLHDKRSTNSPPNGYPPPPSYNNNNYNNNNNNTKPKTHSHGLIVDSNATRRPAPKPDVTAGQWAHDLHDSVAQDTRPIPPPPATVPNHTAFHTPPRPVPTAPRSSPPNRSFSSSVLVGNVPVIVFLPGMKNPIPYAAVPKKQHTRLPQHRPPLRRDKPVRISVPGQPPRYIFPSTERSFIFIPRALRPNQQFRQRGRGGFYGGGGRRTSVYGGSVYTPSVAMSRRSSFGRGTDAITSPVGSAISRVGGMPGEGRKPVVRLPPSIRPPLGSGFAPQPPAMVPQMTAPPLPSQYPMPPPPEFRENRLPQNIPMHQPRPQKTVSVADIESPVSFQYNPPQQQQEQPFRQQVPHPVNGGFIPDNNAYAPHGRRASHASQPSATPLSQIPERAIHAHPFQPYPYQPQTYYTEAGYQPAPMFYPTSNPEYPTYATTVRPGPPPATYAAQPQQMPFSVGPPLPHHPSPTHQHPAPDQEQASSATFAHEQNGTVYYYDTSQFANSAYPPQQNQAYSAPPPQQGVPPGGVVGMGGMMTPPGTTYYYPQPQNGTVYYT
ncbi:uncharacterized protein PADG_12012 [Paracoccidioides brasiliensis Pb18]|uniref:Btz domain-containing protein n=1 Tax=Paracoccidioides brasiliensis (strain Pb18) TaxID=502780 RepID=A0A0A0HV13_PARBD|nr:uncharacterized protein PADG_12012 [Paracoccidioides brasiliensis Pb18]KGM91871.1 hypothetical protein PADG_12012 [Paracoccidioides brasiliensis Pb18]